MKLLNLVLLTIQAVSAADVDCYKLLGVTKKDTNKKIKSAYRFVSSYLDRVFNKKISLVSKLKGFASKIRNKKDSY